MCSSGSRAVAWQTLSIHFGLELVLVRSRTVCRHCVLGSTYLCIAIQPVRSSHGHTCAHLSTTSHDNTCVVCGFGYLSQNARVRSAHATLGAWRSDHRRIGVGGCRHLNVSLNWPARTMPRWKKACNAQHSTAQHSTAQHSTAQHCLGYAGVAEAGVVAQAGVVVLVLQHRLRAQTQHPLQRVPVWRNGRRNRSHANDLGRHT